MPQLRRLVTAVAAAGALGLSTLAAAPALAGTCTDNSTTPPTTVSCPDPVITGVTVAANTVQHTAQLLIPVTVTVSDPSGLVDQGVDLALVQGTSLVDLEHVDAPATVSGTTKTFKLNIQHFSDDPWGKFNVFTFANATNATDGGVDGPTKTITLQSTSTVTNTPSLTTITKGQAFVERGVLRRFDGSPLAGQTVRIYYVPAGQTRASLAGYATTNSAGAFALTVRAWYTGSWFVNYAGSTSATGTYKGAWVQVR